MVVNLRRKKICQATSPEGYWCTRTDRHTMHEARTTDGLVGSWAGDFPYDPPSMAWTPFISTLKALMNSKHSGDSPLV